MLFNFTLGISDEERKKYDISNREAVRGVIIEDGKILLAHTNEGDYKFPGGGKKSSEYYDEALMREIEEETGYIAECIVERIGRVVERRLDTYKDNTIFEMISNYYVCRLTGEKVEQNLDEYEKNLGFHPEWVTLEEAIKANESVLESGEHRAWVNRETMVLKELLKAEGKIEKRLLNNNY